MTGFDLMKLLHRLEAQSRRDFMPPHSGPHHPPHDDPHHPPCGAPHDPPHDAPPPPPFNVHHGKGRIVSVLHRHAGITQKELSEKLAIRPQSLSDALSKLEADGIIYRERSEEDKRELRLYLTESGKKTAEEVHSRRIARAEEFFSPLTAEEKDVLGSILQKLCCEHDINNDK